MKILITGATGYVGTTLVPYLLEHGIKQPCLLVRNKEKAQTLYADNALYIDSSTDSWREVLIAYNPDVVLHMAGLLNSHHDAETAIALVNSNILLTTELLEAVSHTDCQYFINVGTCWEFRYGNEQFVPNTLYAATKSAVHPIISFYQTQSKWKWVNVILYSAYGKRNVPKKIFELLYDSLDAPKPMPFTKGEQILDFIHVDDIADFFYTLLKDLNKINDPFIQFHLGTGKGYSLREVAQVLERLTGKHVNADWGALPYRPHELMYCVAPIAKNIEILGWRATKSIEDGWGGVIRSISSSRE